MSKGSLYTHIQNGIATVEFYHEAGNSFPSELLKRLTNAFNELSENNEVSVIILKSEKEYFALIGRKTSCHWVGENSDDLPEDVEEFEDNDLDFEMI